MSFALLAPLYLLGLLGLSVPIILHLLHQRPQRVHDFPTLRFLLKKKMTADRQRNLKRFLILLLRMAAIAALALAFAYPILKKMLPKQPLGRVVILDNSASMSVAGRQKQADLLAKRELLTTSGERVSVAFIDFSSQPHVTDFQSLSQHGPMPVLARVAPPKDAGTNPAEALRAAARLLMEQPFEKREIVVISDFAGDTWAADDLRGSLPKGITLRCQPLGLPPVEGNLAVTELKLPRSIYGANESVTIKARLHNYSASPRDAGVKLDWTRPGMPEAPVQRVTLAALADTEVEFNVLTVDDKPLNGHVAISESDPFPQDNARFFVIPANEPLRVARLQAKAAPANPLAEPADIFLKTAFAPHFDTENRRFAWRDVAFSGGEPLKLSEPRTDLLLVDQGLKLSAAQAEELGKYVKGGGKVLFFLGEAEHFQDWEKALLGDSIKLGRERTVSKNLAGGATRFARARLEHPLLAPFAQPGGGNIFATEVKRWREFTLNGDKAEALVSTDSGQPMVALLPVESGHAMLWAFPPNRDWTDWPLQTTFLPFLYRFAEFGGADSEGTPGNYIVGDPSLPEIGAVSAPNTGVIEGEKPVYWALNLDPKESELNPVISVDLLPTLAVSTTGPTESATEPGLQRPIDPSKDPSGRWVLWLLAGMLIFSLGELMLANRTAT